MKNNKSAKILAILAFFFITNSSFAQQWCTEKFKADSFNIKSSPDYGKEFTLYFFDLTKPLEGKDMYFTEIFKVSFKFYGGNQEIPIPFTKHMFKSFNQYLKENVDESIKSLYMRQTYSRFSRVNYCVIYEDLKDRLAYEKEYAKKMGWNVKVMEQYIPENMDLEPQLRDDRTQNISFNVVR